MGRHPQKQIERTREWLLSQLRQKRAEGMDEAAMKEFLQSLL